MFICVFLFVSVLLVSALSMIISCFFFSFVILFLFRDFRCVVKLLVYLFSFVDSYHYDSVSLCSIVGV